MRLLRFDVVFWSPVYRDRDAEEHAREYHPKDTDVRVGIRRPLFGLRRFESLRFLWQWTFWFGWVELRRRERAGAWQCPDCDLVNQRETRICACGRVWE